jgi:hypothetical protein
MIKEMKIKKVILQIGDKEISVTVEEAKELMELLNKTFSNEKMKIEYVPYYPYPYVYPNPQITWTTCDSGTVTIGNTGGTISSTACYEVYNN